MLFFMYIGNNFFARITCAIRELTEVLVSTKPKNSAQEGGRVVLRWRW